MVHTVPCVGFVVTEKDRPGALFYLCIYTRVCMYVNVCGVWCTMCDTAAPHAAHSTCRRLSRCLSSPIRKSKLTKPPPPYPKKNIKPKPPGRLRAEYVQPIIQRNKAGLIEQGLSDPNKVFRLLKTLGPGKRACCGRGVRIGPGVCTVVFARTRRSPRSTTTALAQTQTDTHTPSTPL